jgi:hypothetical protein
VKPIIDLAPGADENELATELAARVRANLEKRPKNLADFRALRATILVVADDTGESLTLRFDHGRLTIHDGAIGIPAVTFCAARELLLGLPEAPIRRWLRSPRAVWRHFVAPIASGGLKIYGLAAHPRLVLASLRLLSRHR